MLLTHLPALRSGSATALVALLAACVGGSGGTAGAGTSATAAQPLPPNDRLLVLPTRVGPYRYLNGWKRGSGEKRNDYGSAVAAFDQPSSRRAEWLPAQRFPDSYGKDPKSAGYCHVTWRDAGLTVSFFSWSGWWPPDEDDTSDVRAIDPCEPTEVAQAALTSVRLFGPGWRNRIGHRVGELPPAGRPRSVRTDFRRADGRATVMMSVELDRRGRVSALEAEILGWP